MTYLSPVDMHVHMRGEEYTEDFYELAQADAQAVGLCRLGEMPNFKPFPVTADAYSTRQARGQKAVVPVQVHGCITDDARQAADMLMHLSVVGHADKIFYSHSTGNLGLLDKDYQAWLWRLKYGLCYEEVSMGHFEDPDQFVGTFNPARPESHSEHQPPEAETICVERQLRSAIDAGFDGTFYICHVSNPATVELVKQTKHDFPVVLEITFHHMFLNVEEDYPRLGNLLRCNPPIRSKKLQEQLLEMTLRGDFHVIGTDHAPHPLVRKTDPVNPACGLPALPFWLKGIEKLQALGMSKERLARVTYWNSLTTFGLSMPRGVNRVQDVTCEYDPKRWDVYGFNPFARVDH